MSITPKFFASIKDGKLFFNIGQRELFNNYITKWPDGKEVELTIKAKYKKRTSGQPDEETNFNGYYWGVIIKIIGDELGYYTKEELEYIHDWLQMKIGNVKIMPDKTMVPAGTSNKSGAEFAEYCSKARMFASTPGNICEQGMYIPEPNEAEYEER